MTDDLIEVQDHALDPASCARLIELFRERGNPERGLTGGGLNLAAKDSWDIGISGLPEWKQVEDALNGVMFRGMMAYLRRRPYVALAPLALSWPRTEGGIPEPLTPERFAALGDAELGALMVRVFRPGTINLQRYVADEGGYPAWHCELYPTRQDDDPMYRLLLWTIYLNDGFEGGETEFLFQQRSITPKTGSLLIAPTAFTHTHRGNRPRGADKFIATSWLLFQRPERLFA